MNNRRLGLAINRILTPRNARNNIDGGERNGQPVGFNILGNLAVDEDKISASSKSPLDEFTPSYPRESSEFLIRMSYNDTNCKTLKDSCLFEIVLNFDSIMQMYFYYKKHGVEMKQYEYLKRLYSKTLFETLSCLKKMKESYLPFLLNEHLTELNLSVYPFHDVRPLLENATNIRESVTCLNLSSKTWPPCLLIPLISMLPNLEVLHLDMTNCESNVLGCIKKQCPRVKYISLTNNFQIADDSLHFLCSLDENNDLKCNPVIEHLDFEDAAVTEEGIQFALKYFPSLNFIRNRYVAEAIYALHRDDLHSGNLQKLPKYNLSQMSIYSDTSILDVLKICTVLCPLISSLSIDKISLQEEIYLCLKFSHLKKVRLLFDQHSDLECSPEFFDVCGDNLEKLHLACTQLSVASLKKCRKLRELNLTHPMFEELDSSFLHSSHTFKRLHTLEINTADLSNKNNFDSVLYIIASSPNLERLILHQVSGISEEVIDLILECRCVANLVELDFSFTTVKASKVKKCIMVIPKLAQLIIEYSGISYLEYKEIDLFQKTSHVRPVDVIWKNGQWFP